MKLLLIILLSSVASAQVVQIIGGSSSIYQASGGSAVLYFPNSTVTIGGGSALGQAGFSIADSFKWNGYSVTIGDKNFFGGVDALGGVGLSERGVFLERAGLGVFAGSTGSGYQLPFFQTVKSQHIGAGLSYRVHIRNWTVATVAALSGGQRTAAASILYKGHGLSLTGAGGLLAGRAAATGAAAYSPISALHFSAIHQTFPGSEVSSVGAFASLGPVSLNASGFSGASAGRSVNGANLGAVVRWGMVSAQGGAFRSAGRLLTFSTVTESARHWSLTETVSRSQGQTSISAGGGFHSNRLAVSVNQGVGFEPGRGYVKTESISLTIRLRDSAVTLAANEAGGVTRYSAYGSDFTHGPYAGATGGAVHQFHVGGRFTISGNVRDRAGNAVEGAAVSLNKVVVYSDSAGLFSSRTNKHTVTVEVMPEQFSAPGRWLVVAAPSQAEASVVIEVIVSKN